MLKISDFKKNNVQLSDETHYTFYETEKSFFDNCCISIDATIPKAEELKNFIEKINKQVDWLNTHTAYLKEEVSNKKLSLAEDWVSSSEEAEDEEQECYMVWDDKVFLPLTKEVFCQNMFIDSISLDFKNSHSEPEITICFDFDPDYFFGHKIMMGINPDKEIEYQDLVG